LPSLRFNFQFLEEKILLRILALCTHSSSQLGQGTMVLWCKQNHFGPTTIKWLNSYQFLISGQVSPKNFITAYMCLYMCVREIRTNRKTEKTHFLKGNYWSLCMYWKSTRQNVKTWAVIPSKYLNSFKFSCKCENIVK
jgi:hypothetical protein